MHTVHTGSVWIGNVCYPIPLGPDFSRLTYLFLRLFEDCFLDHDKGERV